MFLKKIAAPEYFGNLKVKICGGVHSTYTYRRS